MSLYAALLSPASLFSVPSCLDFRTCCDVCIAAPFMIQLTRPEIVVQTAGLTAFTDFFAPRFDEATKMGGKMIKAIQDAR